MRCQRPAQPASGYSHRLNASSKTRTYRSNTTDYKVYFDAVHCFDRPVAAEELRREGWTDFQPPQNYRYLRAHEIKVLEGLLKVGLWEHLPKSIQKTPRGKAVLELGRASTIAAGIRKTIAAPCGPTRIAVDYQVILLYLTGCSRQSESTPCPIVSMRKCLIIRNMVHVIACQYQKRLHDGGRSDERGDAPPSSTRCRFRSWSTSSLPSSPKRPPTSRWPTFPACTAMPVVVATTLARSWAASAGSPASEPVTAKIARAQAQGVGRQPRQGGCRGGKDHPRAADRALLEDHGRHGPQHPRHQQRHHQRVPALVAPRQGTTRSG